VEGVRWKVSEVVSGILRQLWSELIIQSLRSGVPPVIVHIALLCLNLLDSSLSSSPLRKAVPRMWDAASHEVSQPKNPLSDRHA
jgi:hypothetical protein